MKKSLPLLMLLAAVTVTAQVPRFDLMILDGAPESGNLGCLDAGDIDGDGNVEIVTGGEGALLWYRAATREKGVIDKGHFHVGVAIEDIDGDGLREVIAGRRAGDDPKQPVWELRWYKAGRAGWTHGAIAMQEEGGPHDVLFADIDGDGARELVANAMYSRVPGLFIYRRPSSPGSAWTKFTVQRGIGAEGTAVGDLDGDGKPEIISGPYLYKMPAAGPFSAQWTRLELAPGIREMCRDGLIDLNGDGRLDAVVVESEYPDGRLSWFENKGSLQWEEHAMERPLNFAHSLWTGRDPRSGGPLILVAEMSSGGWDAPYNWDARLLGYAFAPRGTDYRRVEVYRGMGTHQAMVSDVDGDGELEIVGKTWKHPKIQIWKMASGPTPVDGYKHRFLDREKPVTCIDVLGVDLGGDKRNDVVCGPWWYQNPGWERRDIPGIYQALGSWDLNKDGRADLVAIKQNKAMKPGERWYAGLSADLCWLENVDPLKGQWKEHPIGTGMGDWPHGFLVAPILPGGRIAVIAGYHSADREKHYPEIFEAPDKPGDAPWPKRVLAEIPFGEEMVPADINGDGKPDLVMGSWWIENRGDGTFRPHKFVENFKSSRVVVTDVNSDGRPDIVVSEEDLDYKVRRSHWSRIAWFENPGDPTKVPFRMHVIDNIRCPHALGLADVDGDGVKEIIGGEHDPFQTYRSRGHLYVYKRGDPKGLSWYRYELDDRFEHHVGARTFELEPGRIGILSHGWAESRYLHLWAK